MSGSGGGTGTITKDKCEMCGALVLLVAWGRQADKARNRSFSTGPVPSPRRHHSSSPAPPPLINAHRTPQASLTRTPLSVSISIPLSTENDQTFRILRNGFFQQQHERLLRPIHPSKERRKTKRSMIHRRRLRSRIQEPVRCTCREQSTKRGCEAGPAGGRAG